MKKGFTLVELLAVIIILSILIIIAIPTISEVATSIKKSNLETTKRILEKTMIKYAGQNDIDEIKPDGDTCKLNNCCIYYSIDYIREYNIFQAEDGIINPVTGGPLEGYIKVSYDLEKYVLVAEYEENADDLNYCLMVEVG